MNRPNILSIAGLDPSGGAGVLADVKTAESNGVYCCGVISALTYQNDTEFDDVEWVETEKIIRQIHVLRRRIVFRGVKIGLIADLQTLETVVMYLRDTMGDIPVVWDPILKASAGFAIHDENKARNFTQILGSLSLVTPNIPEASQLFGTSDCADILELVRNGTSCPVLLKGGHSEGTDSIDYLITGQEITPIAGIKYPGFEKHGTGCILSSAITSGVARDMTWEAACVSAKSYIATAITSNQTLLAYHCTR